MAPSAARAVAEPQQLLLSPDPSGEIDAEWVSRLLPRTAKVYADHALLWRSARVLLAAGAIITPTNVRSLVEQAYDEEAADAIPPAFERAFMQARGRAGVAVGLARQDLLAFERPYRRDAAVWERDVRTPTRLEEQPHQLVRLARWEADGLRAL